MGLRSVKRYGPSGLARVTVGKEKVTVAFKDGDTYEIFREDAPDEIKAGEYIVSINADKTKIMGVQPPKGTYFAKFVGFSHKQDEAPIYREVAAREGTNSKTGDKFYIKRHLEFTAIFEVTKKDFAGLQIPFNMWYCFEPDDQYPGESLLIGSGRGKVEDFLSALGFDFLNDSIPYSDNVLPQLQETLLSKDTELVLTVNDKGYIDEVVTSP